MEEQKQASVLVTGASGYLASHVINLLLEAGYKVRGTVRSLKNQAKVDPIKQINPSKVDQLELVEADLLDLNSWDAAVQGMQYVCHVASPFPNDVPKNENEVIKPAVEGTKAVLDACLKHGVKKVIVTSSIAAIFTGRKDKNHFTENDWSDLATSPPYEKSKCLAEQYVWEFYKKHHDKIKITTINPGFIQGPSFHGNQFTSADLIVKVLKDDIPGIPKVSFPTVDVRDVAQAHLAAIQKEDLTNGKRYVLVEGSYWMEDIIDILREEFKKYGYKIVSFTVGPFLFKFVSCVDKQAELLKPFIGRMITLDNTKSRTELGIVYRNNRDTYLSMAYDLIEKGLVPDKTKNIKKK